VVYHAVYSQGQQRSIHLHSKTEPSDITDNK